MRSLIKAVAFATQEHMGQTRVNGTEPYIVHPIRVAAEAEECGLGADAVVAAVLHDVIEDCPRPQQNAAFIRQEWPGAWPLVDRLTKKDDKAAYYAAILADPVALALKLLDRADNLEDMFRMLRMTARPDTIKGNLRWSQGYLAKTTAEVDPLAAACAHPYAVMLYREAKARLTNIVDSVS